MKKILQAIAIAFLAIVPCAGQQRQVHPQQRAQISHSSALKAPAAIIHNWVSQGQAEWVDDIFSGCYPYFQAYKTDVTYAIDTDNPGWYALVNPYGPESAVYSFLQESEYLVADDAERHLAIDASDPDNVIIYPSLLGFTKEGEEVFVVSMTYYELIGEESTAAVEAYKWRGTLSNGIISFPGKNALWLTTAKLDKEYHGFYANTTGNFKVSLPGSADYSFELLTSSWCADEQGRALISPWCGADIAYAKAVAVKSGTPAPTDAQFASAQRLEPKQGAYLQLPAGYGPNEPYTIYARAYNTAGVLKNESTHTVYTPAAANGWKALDNNAVFTDHLLSCLYSDINLGTYEVAVEEEIAHPGHFRLVNPYKDAPYNVCGDLHGGHSHYIYINASDPQYVEIEDSPIGYTLTTDGDVRVTSAVSLYASRGLTREQAKQMGAFGSMVDGVITFPLSAYLYLGFHTEGPESKWNVNMDFSGAEPAAGKLKIDLSNALQGIADIENAQAPCRYFNLQGIEITTPSKGAPCIKVQNGKSHKFIP